VRHDPAVPSARDVVFVTGYPGSIGRRLVAGMASRRATGSVRFVALALPEKAAAARAELGALGVAHEVLEGDVTRMHLGLSGDEYKRVLATATEIWHLAAHVDLSADPRLIHAVNVEGTRNVLELARACGGLRRLHHFSSAFVSGDRTGVVLEDELESGQRFDDAYARSKFEAERLVRRAHEDLPITIYRPSMVVGDSRSGEIDRFEGPYFLAALLVATPLALPLPLPHEGGAPLNAVPVDFVVEAALSIGANPAGVGRTVHLVDPAPLPVRRVYELIAARVGKTLPRAAVPHRAVEAILRLPFLERVARPQRSAIQLVNRLVLYNPANMLALLAGTGIRCPPIHTYLDRLVDYVKAHYEAAREPPPMSPGEDPLAPAPPSPTPSPRA
jgi:nucleoside-diphosphate-sugar epimerase